MDIDDPRDPLADGSFDDVPSADAAFSDAFVSDLFTTDPFADELAGIHADDWNIDADLIWGADDTGTAAADTDQDLPLP
ncbi:hypothetical protein [Microbacterium sp. NPDC077184]|uniref:hypothetical protein n=1 Tax=Microbacterium sp. NPDC077184 TaxID=3154764 RepID=UPI0034338E8A